MVRRGENGEAHRPLESSSSSMSMVRDQRADPRRIAMRRFVLLHALRFLLGSLCLERQDTKREAWVRRKQIDDRSSPRSLAAATQHTNERIQGPFPFTRVSHHFTTSIYCRQIFYFYIYYICTFAPHRASRSSWKSVRSSIILSMDYSRTTSFDRAESPKRFGDDDYTSV